MIAFSIYYFNIVTPQPQKKKRKNLKKIYVTFLPETKIFLLAFSGISLLAKLVYKTCLQNLHLQSICYIIQRKKHM